MSQQPPQTYKPEIECQVEDGHADWEAVVTVADEDGHRQNLSVTKGMVARDNGKCYLPVGIVRIDHHKRRVLVELPHEADSGVNRLWMAFDSFRAGG